MDPALIDTLVGYGVRTIGVVIALFVAVKAARWLGSNVTTTLEKRKFDATLSRFFGNIVRYLILISAVLACLSIFGIQTTSFAAILGASALAIGMAFQGTLSNFSAGVLLLVFRPFNVDEVIRAAGHVGTVKELGLFVTTLATADGRTIFVPNSAIAGGSIENLHNAYNGDKRRVDVSVGCDYGAGISATREVLEAAANAIAKRDAELGHQVIVLELGDSSVNWQVRVWCSSADYWDVLEDTITQVKAHLAKADIGIPYPTMDVNVTKA